MIKAVIIEDEQRNIELLTALIDTHCSDLVKIEGCAKDLPAAIALIRNKRPQLVYLDIELNQGNAFELLDALGEIDFQVIFLTAFDKYAVKAFRYNALDYLLKPVSITELKEATKKAVNRKNDTVNNKALLEAIKQLKSDFSTGKIGIPVLDGVSFVNIADIIKVQASGSYTILHMTNGKKITATKNLKDVEALLPESSFLRVHNSWIINTRYLKKYYRGKTGYMEMEDGSTVQVSLRKKKFLLGFLNE